MLRSSKTLSTKTDAQEIVSWPIPAHKRQDKPYHVCLDSSETFYIIFPGKPNNKGKKENSK